MAVSKVVLGNETLIDLTGDSVSSENLLQGETAHGANGEEVIGGVVVTPMYTGTKAAIKEAIALGKIPEDAVVNITDDEETSSFQTQINEINSSLTANSNQFYFDYQDGKYGFNTDPNRGADTFSPFSSDKTYISINEFKSTMTPTHYDIGFKPKIVFCGANIQAGFEWYNSETNKHYYNADTNTPYDLGSYGAGTTYKFDSVDDTGFTFNVGNSSYNNQNLIIIAMA